MATLILGGSGFLGRHLVEGLDNVIAPPHKELDLLKDSVSDYVRGKKIDCIVNAAGYGVYGQELPDMVEQNMRMIANIAKAPVELVINVASGAVYGKHQNIVKVKETKISTPPVDRYGFARWLGAEYLLFKRKHIANLCPFGIFGKYEDPDYRFISNAITRTLRGEPIIIYRDARFTYQPVEHFVAQVKRLISLKQVRGYYNTGGFDTTLRELAVMVGKASGKRVEITMLDNDTGYEYTCNSDKIDCFGVEPKLSLEKAVSNLYKWHARNTTL